MFWSIGRDKLLVGIPGIRVPPPVILERLDLRPRWSLVSLLVEDVEVALRVERRIQINQIYGFLRDVPAAKYVEVVGRVELANRHASPPERVCGAYSVTKDRVGKLLIV